jgi:glutamine cyclotransferase
VKKQKQQDEYSGPSMVPAWLAFASLLLLVLMPARPDTRKGKNFFGPAGKSDVSTFFFSSAAFRGPSLPSILGFPQVAAKAPERLAYRIVKTYPHDPEAFTQGLVFLDGYLYEGTGQYGTSSIRKVDIDTGKVIKISRLERDYFGEGITILGDRIYQLTWHAATAFVYDLATFDCIDTRRFPISVEGWGLTTDGRDLIMGDGSSDLFYLDPESLELKKRLPVTLNDSPVYNINELEYVAGSIFANVWQTDYIIRIDSGTGRVTGIIDLRRIAPAMYRGHTDNVLNGIAYDPATRHFYVTGKMWPELFEIELL